MKKNLRSKKPALVASKKLLRTELIEYCNEIIAGKILACQKNVWACKRFLNDLERSDRGDPNFPYEFEPLWFKYDNDYSDPVLAGERYGPAERFFIWMKLFKHRKGILRGGFISPAPIQKFVFGNIYGWVHKKTKYRRFRKFYWQVARKNAKSQSLACVGTYELMAFDLKGIETNEVYTAATKTEQAKIIYDEAVAMLDGCRDLQVPDKKYTVAYGRIIHNKSGSVMRPLSEEDRKSGDGLNPQCGIIDEYHAHEDSLVCDIIESGMGARAQPLLGIITTAGFDLNNPCYRVEYNLAEKILNPDSQVIIEDYFVMINELDKNNTSEDIRMGQKKIPPGELIDDITNEQIWIKANPIACSYDEGIVHIRSKLKEAIAAPEKMRNFLTKYMDIWVSQREFAYMDMAQWNLCAGEMPDLHGLMVTIGGDLSTKDDLTSVGFEFIIDDIHYVKQHSFLPEAALEKKMLATHAMPWGLWVQQGWITKTEGNAVDYRFVKKYIDDEIKKYNWSINAIGLDPWNASQLFSDFIDEYGDKIVVALRQGRQTLSEPTKDFRILVKSRRLVHENDPLLNFAVLNAVVSADNNANIKIDKIVSKEKIDPLTALINAHVRAMVIKPVAGGRVFFV